MDASSAAPDAPGANNVLAHPVRSVRHSCYEKDPRNHALAGPRSRIGVEVSFTLLALAAVDILALVGGVYTLLRAARRARNLVRIALSSSLAVAARRARLTFYRQAFKCASDLHYYTSRLAILLCVNLLTLSGVIFAALASVEADISGPASEAMRPVATGSMVVFAALAARSVLRTLKLARKVMQIRMRRRSAEARIHRFSRRISPVADK
jgi:hypothetical protein